ncbi:DUF732 domain-containing protein [Mycobacterium sp. 94-17]|uniref:DUF732 domain-containing protein n=1 Tax=Mycobacterium sp. 94-17 TaxID=2986147 RepID=UPI002D1F607E|nr:DUF732 domain-containing protein [Mycobacterium sp. 94-17]MEB4208735.1 DUF732 domain-containing protein [Mycobacterium sp. 94-17]
MLFHGDFIATTTLAAGAAVAGIAFAAPAHADETAYLNDLHNAGISDASGDAALLQVGWDMCRQLSNGTSLPQLRAQVLYNSDTGQGSNGVDPAQANDIVNYAMADLCPSA